MIKTIKIIKGKTTRLINLPKQMLEELGWDNLRQVQVENNNEKLTITITKGQNDE